MLGFSLLPDNLDFSRARCRVRESTLAGARAFILENGVLSVSVLPEYGGRLCSLFYRPANIELLATEFIHQDRQHFTVRGGWCGAFPSLLADGEMIATAPWEAAITNADDDQITLRLWCSVERISHRVDGQVRVTPGMVHVERFIRMSAGTAAIEVEDVLTNRSSWPLPVTWAGMIALRAQPGDVAVLPVDAVEIQRGVGPSGNELDFGLLVSTPYQALARNLQDGWLGFRPHAAPIDVRITFPHDLLPHAVIQAQRHEQQSVENAFRFQPLATPGPIADDSRGGALILPPKAPVRLPIRLEAGAQAVTASRANRPGLQLAELIGAQHVPAARMAIWRIGPHSFALKTPHYLALLMHDFDDAFFAPEDLPAADLILCGVTPDAARLERLAHRTTARFIGPPGVRHQLVAGGFGEDRAITLSPGARCDLPGFSVLATPARLDNESERLGFVIHADNLQLYHTGLTHFLGEFGLIGRQFSPQLVLLPLAGMSLPDAIHATKQLLPRLVVPLGVDDGAEHAFLSRCRELHMAFESQTLYQAEGVLFDGWRLRGLNSDA